MSASRRDLPARLEPAPNPDWRYSRPRVSSDGRIVHIDAMQLTWATEHQRQADARGNGRGWGR